MSDQQQLPVYKIALGIEYDGSKVLRLATAE